MSPRHAWTDLAACYAIDALDDAERAQLELHLASCAACRTDVLQYREVAASLARAVPRVAPPASLRRRVLTGATRGPGAMPSRSADRRARPSRGAWLAAAASILLAVASFVLFTEERARRVDAEAAIAAIEEQLGTAATRAAHLDSLLDAVLARDARSLTLIAQGQPPSVRIFWSRQRGRVVLAAHELAPAPAGRTYQLWGIRNGQPVGIGTFNTDARGSATVTLAVDPGLTFAVSAVTEEPAGGSELPTTAPFLLGTWPAP